MHGSWKEWTQLPPCLPSTCHPKLSSVATHILSVAFVIWCWRWGNARCRYWVPY